MSYKHPAKFTADILDIIHDAIPPGSLVVDPFAGTGRIHQTDDSYTVGVELEPEWASMARGTLVGNALFLPLRSGSADVIATSPTYGNRFADHHNARDGSRRRSYTHDLGRKLHPDNSGALHWGDGYRIFHLAAWVEARRMLRPGGLFLLNVKDHVRGGVRQEVTSWHLGALVALGLEFRWEKRVPVHGLRHGANRARVEYETVACLEKSLTVPGG